MFVCAASHEATAGGGSAAERLPQENVHRLRQMSTAEMWQTNRVLPPCRLALKFSMMTYPNQTIPPGLGSFNAGALGINARILQCQQNSIFAVIALVQPWNSEFSTWFRRV